MQQAQRLAIVIPAFKKKFLRETLDSLKNQTNKAFSVYIGDDNSPENLWEIIKDFIDELDIIYKKYESNWGAKDLVSHWNRCIDLVKDEDWIWLFSDDDCMNSNCVESFYQFIKKNPDKDLIHFNVKVIDSSSKEIMAYRALNNFPSNMTGSEFFKAKILHKIHSYVIEYVFKRQLIDSYGKFINFDLAWCSDDATWINFAQSTGISTIEGVYVRWRLSDINISSIKSDSKIVIRKLEAKLNYFIWIKSLFKTFPIDNLSIIKWFYLEIIGNQSLSIFYKIRVSFKYTKKLFGYRYAFLANLYILQKEVRIAIGSFLNYL
ncbi:glycosyltransferase family 2 protein [Runella slithyformis]|uniref:Glycosyl transferase family 2 n=1 Tax=Runella slithyformis (strain ATCC 29530 / DSM 19594 / LMG 11500 / NCIMB 11436 / LSU 4) TaxID=761193 RepID=A0A7U3ZPJ3_RUNSL|nr:glycosyltransferase family 2 protein [Runella slithyformis]AEI51012.1 glycosyl transferase family 2 [Runella slithyformis DSM 19594]